MIFIFNIFVFSSIITHQSTHLLSMLYVDNTLLFFTCLYFPPHIFIIAFVKVYSKFMSFLHFSIILFSMCSSVFQVLFLTMCSGDFFLSLWKRVFQKHVLTFVLSSNKFETLFEQVRDIAQNNFDFSFFITCFEKKVSNHIL